MPSTEKMLRHGRSSPAGHLASSVRPHLAAARQPHLSSSRPNWRRHRVPCLARQWTSWS